MDGQGDNGLFVQERWERIHEVLEQDGRATVEELADRFNVSRSTIRRDLLEMHRLNLLVRTRGGAVKPVPVAFDRPLSVSETLNLAAKAKIGQLAASLIADGETVMVDAGSTTLQVVKHLEAVNITLVTNSFDAALCGMANPNIDTMMVGGMIRSHGGATCGPMAEDQIRGFTADTAILGINGVSVIEGLTTPNVLSAQMKKTMIRNSRRFIIVADSSKLGLAALCKVAPLADAAMLVCDADADAEDLAEFEAAGLEILIAK
jgi:DeoR/GlpR family transcriptional regulator of sugar metabolism